MNKDRKNKFESNKKYFTISIYTIITFCICLFIYKFTNNWAVTKAHFSSITGMLAPFLIAFLIAYFVNPMVHRIDHILFGRLREKFNKVHKILSLLISYVILIGFIVLVLTFVIPQVISSISELVVQSSNMYTNIETTFNNFAKDHPNLNLGILESLIQDNLPALIDYMKNAMTDLIPVIYSAGISIINWVINILLAFVISCYLMWGKDRLLNSIKRIIYAIWSKENAVKILRTTRECNRIFSQYIIGKALDSLIIGILCFILMCILNLQYALIISVFVGVTNMIPYFGPFIGAVPGILLLLIIDPKQCLIFAILILVLQQFDGAILGPKILGSSTGLEPIWVIFAIITGGYLAGVLGMFLGVPVTAVIAYLLNKLIDFLLLKKQMRTDLSSLAEDNIPRMDDGELGFSYDEEGEKVLPEIEK